MVDKTREEQDEFRRKLKEEWRLIWWEWFDDRVKTEGIAVRDYPLLFMDRGYVVFAGRAAKVPVLSDVVNVWVSQGCMYAPDPSDGGWGRFIRTEMREPGGSGSETYRKSQPKLNNEKSQLKKRARL